MKIKFNWGTGIVLALVGYVGIIVFLLIISSRQDRSIMREDYYYHSIHHQEDIDAARQFAALKGKIHLARENDSLRIYLPDELLPGEAKVKIQFLRPSDDRYDFSVESSPDSRHCVSLPISRLIKGKYFLRFEMEQDGKAYLHEMDYVFNP
ncbi:MAG: FixH family protein [Bacteroidales bacterium]